MKPIKPHPAVRATLVCLAAVLVLTGVSDARGEQRTSRDLLVLYDFAETDGDVVRDRSGLDPAIDLRIDDTKGVTRSKGTLKVHGKATIRSDKPATKIIDAVRRTGEISIEAWVRPANTKQEGPARIVTLSHNSTNRNFTLGQEGDKYDQRFRTTRTSSNGLPSLASPGKSLDTKLTHVVYTRDRAGRARLYLDGRQVSEARVDGEVSNWDGGYWLALANELSGDRQWHGAYQLVAIFGRALSGKEIDEHYRAGPGADSPPAVPSQPGDDRRVASASHVFETKIAPLLANHCLECHDAATKKGGLDLSTKVAAFRGGDDGKAIVPGKAEVSALWESVESGDMPKKRKPLAAHEVALLKRWIDGGAEWTLDAIDPAVYVHHDAEAVSGLFVQRLTVDEYIETVRAATGVDIAKEARELLPRDLRADGFSNTAYNLGVDLKHVDAYAQLAEVIVSRMDVERFASRFAKSKRLHKDMRVLVEKMGAWLLRGPLTEDEVNVFRGVSSTVVAAGGGFEEAVSYVVMAMLQSPRFVYRIEKQRGDGRMSPVDDYELASRLSYIIWGGPPDEELYRAAEKRELSNTQQLERQVERMLRDGRAIARSERFIAEWLNLGRLANMQPNPKRFPKWDAQLAADMRDETLAFFREVAWAQDRPMTDLFNAQVTFLTPRLAQHYGLTPKPGKSDTPARYDLANEPTRGGLLTHGSVLTVGGDDASMVTRGLFVMHDVMRGVVKDPPPCVDTTPKPSKPGLSQRGIAEQRIANNACGGCHGKFEPLAFGLEHYDGLGTYHQRDEHGNTLRDDGAVRVPGTSKPIAYQSAAELMDVLASSDRVAQTITWKLTQFALGRPLTASDARLMDDVHTRARNAGGTYPATVTAIVTSDLVRMTRTEPKR